jgi:lysozyme
MIPASRPKQSKSETFELIKDVDAPVIILGVRGYYKKLGEDPDRNEINIYDDALFVWSKNGYMTFNGNTDPSISRPKVAKLKPGVWQYRLGIHNISKEKSRQYPALIQAAPVTVSRQGEGDDTGWFGVNIHRGGRTTTASLGCVTIPPAQYDGFYNLVKSEMTRAKVSRIPFVLAENI